MPRVRGTKSWPLINNVEKSEVNHKQLIIFEGFRPNGLLIRNQRIYLHRIAHVKIDFGAFGDISAFLMVSVSMNDIR